MAETIDAITIAYTDPASGEETLRELDKRVLTRGAWTTIVFRYQEKDPRSGDWGAAKYRIGRYRKQGGVFRGQSKFNISSAEQARQLIEILQEWTALDGEA
jgi:hypothetical protein